MTNYDGQDFPILFDVGRAAELVQQSGPDTALTPYRLTINEEGTLIVGPGAGLGAEIPVSAISRLYPSSIEPEVTLGYRWHGADDKYDTMSYDTSKKKRLTIEFSDPQDFYLAATPRKIRRLIVSLYSPRQFAKALGLKIESESQLSE